MPSKITPSDLRAMKARGEKIAALTAYDYPTARLLDEAGIPFILVGDSLGMVVLGYEDTTSVTLADMIHHTRPVARAVKEAFVVADLPYRTYGDAAQALAAARALVDAGADAVKLEGGRDFLPQVKAIVGAGIPLVGHLGMLPQSVREEGGYRVKGKNGEEAARIEADAAALEEAGASAVVLELVVPAVAEAVSRRLSIPTIGIGAGQACDGQILVVHDLMGLFPWFRPKFAQPEAELGAALREAAVRYRLRTAGTAAAAQ
ncbi:MAG: 3-methyl-2-oxobutanoate hydroxymethyltransferase [Verrucomicrobium sp.]|nr:3-methyl-2-oxobutanoate hydroxymethyltransferase [Verrucomicrobium sp.]